MIDYISLIISFLLALLTAVFFVRQQHKFYSSTMKDLNTFQNFFKKTGEYSTFNAPKYYQDDEDYQKKKNITNKRLVNVADQSAELYNLIHDINEYLESCRGTATFNIIENKTERRITKLYDKACSKASFPTHYGLMGTFVGVFLGLLAFLGYSLYYKGINDDAINSLILGVLVSMSTSFIGLRWSTKANDRISNAKKKIDDEKNDFYEFIQNKLMPSVDLSLSESLENLHQTVSEFEPSFSKVINGFRKTFEDCTVAFGDDFRKSVNSMVKSVDLMGKHIYEITENVNLLQILLNRLSSAEWIRYMRQFAESADHFKVLTQSLNDFERARRMMLAAVQEGINMQKSYNDSLNIPREVAQEINTILQRVVKFEESINDLGTDIAATQMLGNTTVEEIKNQISAIKVKHKVAEQYIETSNNKLEMFFDSQLIELKRLEGKYQEALDTLFNSLENLTNEHKDEIEKRNKTFKDAIDEKFELSGVRSELSNLNKIPNIESKVEDVKKGQEKLQRTNEGIRTELNAFNAAKEEENKGALRRILDSSNSAKDRENEQLKKDKEFLEEQHEKDKKLLEEQRKKAQAAKDADERNMKILEQYKQSNSVSSKPNSSYQSSPNNSSFADTKNQTDNSQEELKEKDIEIEKPNFFERILGIKRNKK